MDISLVEGRNFEDNSVTDQTESILINESFVHNLGWTDPIGKEVIYNDTAKFFVIGVFRDIYQNGFFNAIRPMVIMNDDPGRYRQIMLKVNTTDLNKVKEKFGVLYQEVFPNRRYNPRYMDEAVKRALEINTNGISVFLFLGITSLLLTATGLYSLISMNIAKRTKELGVRKILGARTMDLLWLLNYHFAILLIIAFLIGLPLGKYSSDFLMDIVFHYFKPLNVINLVLAAIIILIVFAISIASKLKNTVKENPVIALRAE
jgi:ABC-type antimicrobial peptide transport system permease subunit